MFRIYDASDPVDTLATSQVWQVDAQGRDVELSVRFVLNQLRSTDGKGSVMGALAQLAHLLAHLQVLVPKTKQHGDICRTRRTTVSERDKREKEARAELLLVSGFLVLVHVASLADVL